MTALVVHGGAGKFRPEHEALAKKGCKAALDLGRKLLKKGAPAIDVVEAVVQLLEDDPAFDAGRGSFPNRNGDVEMDAILVDGTTKNFGSVAAIRSVAHPIAVARAVMERTEHCMLVGEGALEFAEAQGFERISEEQLAGEAVSGPDHGTVGAVALDKDGHLAAATSTGGTAEKMAGRVGDSPLIGCGAIADDAVCAAAATGSGEHLMRVQMARTVWDIIRAGAAPQQAAAEAVRRLYDAVKGQGGIICVGRDGRVGIAFNTTHLAVAYVDGEGKSDVRL